MVWQLNMPFGHNGMDGDGLRLMAFGLLLAYTSNIKHQALFGHFDLVVVQRVLVDAHSHEH